MSEPSRVLAAASRRRLLALLRDGREAQSAAELAQDTGLHVTTVRFHLDNLRSAGLVESRPEQRPGVGRPRTLYSARGPADPPPDGYRALAALLAAHLADTPQDRAERAEQAGRAWAAQLVPPPRDGTGTSEQDAAHGVTALFADLGFEPELTAGRRERVIALRACPFRDVAREHPDVVCSVHLGLLRGALDRLAAPPASAGLEPFVEPELCLVRLRPSR